MIGLIKQRGKGFWLVRAERITYFVHRRQLSGHLCWAAPGAFCEVMPTGTVNDGAHPNAIISPVEAIDVPTFNVVATVNRWEDEKGFGFADIDECGCGVWLGIFNMLTDWSFRDRIKPGRKIIIAEAREDPNSSNLTGIDWELLPEPEELEKLNLT